MKNLFLTAALIALSSPVMAEEYTVRMITDMDNVRYYFEPAALTIKAGDTVKWVNVQEDFHNAVADAVPEGAEFFESPMLEEEGTSWSYKFTRSGTYSYHCHPHAAVGMHGWIVVDYTSTSDEVQTSAHGDHDHGAGSESGNQMMDDGREESRGDDHDGRSNHAH